MKEVALDLVNLITGGNWLAAIIVGIPVFIFLFRMFYSLITELKERKINNFKKALEIEGLSDEVRFIVQESLNQAYFYRATGLTASPYLRLKICQFLKYTTKNISLFSIWRCSNYITVDDGMLKIKFDRFDRIDFGWQIFSIVVTGLTSLITLVYLLISWGVFVEGKWMLVGELIALLGITTHSVWKIISFRFARDTLGPEFFQFENTSADKHTKNEQKSDLAELDEELQELEVEAA